MSLARECLLASVGIIFAIGGIKELGAAIPFVGGHAFTIAAAVQLGVPVYLIGKRGITHESLGFHADTWRQDCRLLLIVSVLTLVPFAGVHHLWQDLYLGRRFVARLPQMSEFLNLIATHIAVAVPEELFFRGYLQERMQRLWPPTRRLLGVGFGWAVVIASAVFALVHFAGEYAPVRLAPFIPSLVFAWLRLRTGSLVAPIGYHAVCNIVSDLLHRCYSTSFSQP